MVGQHIRHKLIPHNADRALKLLWGTFSENANRALIGWSLLV